MRKKFKMDYIPTTATEAEDDDRKEISVAWSDSDTCLWYDNFWYAKLVTLISQVVLNRTRA